MNKNLSLIMLVALLGFAGCKKGAKKVEPKKQDQTEQVNIPLAQGDAKSFFEDDINEFELLENQATQAPVVAEAAQPVTTEEEFLQPADYEQQFAWADEEKQAEKKFEVVYFGFDERTVAANEQTKVAANIDQLKKIIADSQKEGKEVSVVIEGHACSSAGTDTYNYLISEQRGVSVKQLCVEAGVSEDMIKVVGRGKDFPAMVNGTPVSGDREQQAPNRRVEIRCVNA